MTGLLAGQPHELEPRPRRLALDLLAGELKVVDARRAHRQGAGEAQLLVALRQLLDQRHVGGEVALAELARQGRQPAGINLEHDERLVLAVDGRGLVEELQKSGQQNAICGRSSSMARSAAMQRRQADGRVSRRGEWWSGYGQVVQLGSRVCIRDADGDDELYVAPPEEADAVADRISAHSPLGQARLGRHVGDVVRFRAPAGVLAVRARNRTIVSIDRGPGSDGVVPLGGRELPGGDSVVRRPFVISQPRRAGYLIGGSRLRDLRSDGPSCSLVSSLRRWR